MQAPALHLGDTIGLVSPSAIPDPEKMQLISAALEGQGYRVRLGKNLFAHGWDYAATDEERAADFTQMALDEDVKLVFFSGGEGADEVLPLLNYTLIAAHPKRYLSFSDGTSILNTLWSRTGMITYYGQTPGDALKELNSYTWQNFRLHMEQPGLAPHIPSAPWRTLRPGEARGTLMGGYLENFLYLLYGGWVRVDPAQDYVLFLEEHEQFFGIPHLSDTLARLEHSSLMPQVRGLLFGEYSQTPNEQLMARLTRFGERFGIPVAYCTDYGHGENHAILPIGASATLDTAKQALCYA